AEISAILAEEAFHCLKAPIIRVTTPDVPIPASPLLEKHIEPSADKVVAAVQEAMK
ncbi:MAG: alpha-ketoacid dehydrogenase subunit beta, partial [Betaproteobacteria bacterium]|nr:alpha-ketoacid dehydrogenase subunit beta [Betaproteobacteria bacterium]